MVNSIPIANFSKFKDKKPADGQVVIFSSKEKKKIGLGYYFESFNMVISNSKDRFDIGDNDSWAPYNYAGNVDIKV